MPDIFALTAIYLIALPTLVICLRILGAWTTPDEIRAIFLMATTGFSLGAMLICLLGALALSELKPKEILRYTLPLWAVLTMVLYLCGHQKFIPHMATNVTTAAFALPYFLPTSTKDILGLAVSLGIVFFCVISNASVPLGVCGVIIASFYLFNTLRIDAYSKNWAILKALLILFLALFPVVAASCYWGFGYVFDSTGRFKAYEAFMSYWWSDNFLTTLFGYAPGSFEVLSQIIQEKVGFMLEWKEERLRGHLWVSMHSQWLQFFVETGLVGFFLILGSFIRLFLSLEMKEKIVLLGIAASGLFDFPLSYPLTPLILVFLFAIALQEAPTRGPQLQR